jgi:hypothetical protein
MTWAADPVAKFQQPDTQQQFRACLAAVCGTVLRAGEMPGYLPGEPIGQPARIAGPGRLAGPHVSLWPDMPGIRRPARPSQDQQDIREAVCAQDAVSECRRRQGVASVARITERDYLGRPGERRVRACRLCAMGMDWVAQLSPVQIIRYWTSWALGASWEHPEGVSIDIRVDPCAEANCTMSNRSPLTRATAIL